MRTSPHRSTQLRTPASRTRSASECSPATDDESPTMNPPTGEWSGRRCGVTCRNRGAGKGFRVQMRSLPLVLTERGIPARQCGQDVNDVGRHRVIARAAGVHAGQIARRVSIAETPYTCGKQ